MSRHCKGLSTSKDEGGALQTRYLRADLVAEEAVLHGRPAE